jgi:transcriptional regulator with XRE-family HTH domain
MKIRTDDKATRRAVGLAVVELRKKRGISQERLARESRIDRSYMSGVEHGQHNPTIDLLIRICRPLQVDLPKLARAIERYWTEGGTPLPAPLRPGWKPGPKPKKKPGPKPGKREVGRPPKLSGSDIRALRAIIERFKDKEIP